MTKKEINKKYAGKYVEIGKTYNWESKTYDYEIRKVS